LGHLRTPLLLPPLLLLLLQNLFSPQSVLCAATGALQLAGRPVGGLALSTGIRGKWRSVAHRVAPCPTGSRRALSELWSVCVCKRTLGGALLLCRAQPGLVVEGWDESGVLHVWGAAGRCGLPPP